VQLAVVTALWNGQESRARCWGAVSALPPESHRSFPPPAAAAASRGGLERLCTSRAKILRVLWLEVFEEQKAVYTKITVSVSPREWI